MEKVLTEEGGGGEKFTGTSIFIPKLCQCLMDSCQSWGGEEKTEGAEEREWWRESQCRLNSVTLQLLWLCQRCFDLSLEEKPGCSESLGFHKRITVEGLVSLLSKNNRFLTSGQVTANMDALLKHISVVILDFTVEKRQDQNGLFWMSGSDLAR